MIILGRQFRAIRSIIAVGISPTQGEPLATVESLLREVLRLDESMSDVDLLSIRDMFDDSNSLEREKYEECLGAVFEMLRLEKAYLSKMRECCEEHALPKPKHWIRMHEIIDGVEGDIQWKENQLLDLPLCPNADDVECLWALWSGRPFLGGLCKNVDSN